MAQTSTLTNERLSASLSVNPAQPAMSPFVSVIVPCRNEQRHIAQCLDSILANDYPRDRIEVLVVDGMSDDRTREIVKEYVGRDPRIRLLENPKEIIPVAMNTGILRAKGDTIIKMDAHSTYQRNHISLCVAYQEKFGAENVGGISRMSPGADSAAAHAIVLALAHRFGSGNASVKVGVSQPTWSDSAAFGCFKKDLFSRIGLFDEHLKRSSDMDMNMRIRAAGGKVLLVPEIVVNYCADANLMAFLKHNFKDGLWATYVLRFGSKAWSWRHWVPLTFVFALAGLFVLSPLVSWFRWLALGLAGLYVVAGLIVSLQIAIHEKSMKLFFFLPVVFAVRHFVHGIGALCGLVLVILPQWRREGSKGSQV